MMHWVFVGAAGAYFLGTFGLLVWLVCMAQASALVRQELIWTLVPALVVVGLALLAERPQPRGATSVVSQTRELATRLK